MKAGRARWMALLALIHITATGWSQARNANWLRGCWVSFSTTEAQVAPLPPGAETGSVSLSDPFGNLYITAGGMSGINDANFQPIANEPVVVPWMGNSGPADALFMPVPGHPERVFYFFYRIVDSQVRQYVWLEVGPDGIGGQLRMTDAGMTSFMIDPAVKCTGIAHANGEDYWFLTQALGTNQVHAFRVGDQGVEEGPVISPGGVVLSPNHLKGFMVASVQGDRFINQTVNNSAPQETSMELYGFDPATGQATLEHTFEGMWGGVSWGAEFSPSGRYLYIMRQEMTQVAPFSRHAIYQYDLASTDIEASRIVIDTHDYHLGGAAYTTNNLCLARDGRIYGNRHPESSLAVILAPNEGGLACQYQEDGWLLDGCIVSVPQPMKRYHDDVDLDVAELGATTAQVLPNPMHSHGELRWAVQGAVHLQWLDALGRVVQEERATAQNGRVPLDGSALATGHYVLRVLPRNEVTPCMVRVSVVR